MQYITAEILAKRLRQIRKKKGLSQKEFADMLDIAPSQLNRLEQGVLNTTLDTIDRICSALKMKPAELFKEK